MFNLDFIIAGFFVILMVVILFFSKKRLESKETRLYGCMIVCSLVNIIINITELLIGYFLYNDLTIILLKFLNKIDLICYILWMSLLLLYVSFITFKKERYDFIKCALIILGTIFIVGEFALPVSIINSNGVMGVEGLAVNYVFGYVLSLLFWLVVILIFNYKNHYLHRGAN